MYKLAITGGIGSGKTTVSNFISDNYDSVYLFNADKESKSHLKKSLSIQHKIINVFGSAVTSNNKLDSSIETIFMVADANFAHISSSLIKDIIKLGGSAKEFIPGAVESELKKILGKRK